MVKVADVPTPKGWKKVRGRKGHLHQPLGRCSIIWAPHLAAWWLEAPRGPITTGCDRWGPWYCHQEADARTAMAEWHDTLERVGWFKMTPRPNGIYDADEIDGLIAKLPLSHATPSYFLADRRPDLSERRKDAAVEFAKRSPAPTVCEAVKVSNT